mgnify:FL=1|tara:strand:+ start:1412 stop:1846 length:435 start_codon:yes stop_codon:yes gene_type:complete
MKWKRWIDKNSIPNLNEPGIYFITHSKKDLTKNEFSITGEIVYIGMSISKKGTKGRLQQFERGMKGKIGIHGGAERVKFKHSDENLFFKDTFISVESFVLTDDEVFNWKQKGNCVKHEYVRFADYLEKFGKLPEFNDQKRSKKK